MSNSKKTIAGNIPSDWDAVLLKKVSQVVRGSSPRPAGDPRYFNGDYLPWITVADVTKDSKRFLNNTESMLTKEGANFTRILNSGTLILTNSGATLGVPKITTIRAGANDGIAAFLDLNGVDKEYLYYFLQSHTLYFRERLAPGIGQPNLNTDIIGDVAIPLPPVYEQKHISRLLVVWDNAISLIDRLLTVKQEQRKGLKQQLLSGKRRFPGFTKPWEEVKLGEIFCNRTESDRTDLPLASITGSGGVVFRDGLDRKDTSSADKSKYLRICPGDIGYNTMRMWQGVSGLSEIEGIVSPAYTIVTPDDSLDSEFMALLFKYPPMVHLFYRYSQGLVSDTWNLKFKHFAEIHVNLPEKKEQEAIAAVFRPIDKEINLLRQQLEAFKKQKKGLMQQLLTGKLRVKADKEEVA